MRPRYWSDFFHERLAAGETDLAVDRFEAGDPQASRFVGLLGLLALVALQYLVAKTSLQCVSHGAGAGQDSRQAARLP